MGRSSSSRCCEGAEALSKPRCHPTAPAPTLAQGPQPPTLAHASFSFTISFSGSTFKANFRFLTVHSWPQKTFCGRHLASNPLPVPDPSLGSLPRAPGALPRPGAGGTHRVFGQSAQDLGEVGVHLLHCPLEELPAAPHEQGVTCGTEGWASKDPRAREGGTRGCWGDPRSAECGGQAAHRACACVPRVGYLRTEPEHPRNRPPT